MFALKPWKRETALLPRSELAFGWMPEEFASLFNPFLPAFPVPEVSEWPYRWGLTTEEKEKEIIYRMEMPGFEAAEVKVELAGERLTVEAEHKVEPPEEGKKGEKVEREYAHAKRVVILPPEVEGEKAEAFYRNGVLEVHIPRKAAAMGRRIEVKT